MTLKKAMSRGFDRFIGGRCDSLAILDKEGETLVVVPLDQKDTIDQKYLDANFISITSNSLVPTRLRLRIDYLEN